ncbi:SDR family NAD(P)-dependent oxidoreductase [bacterium]|nr:SDR family NAD(P)-dependent oxidoreductase [bacterium]
MTDRKSSSEQLNQKIVLITGASSGIGAATARVCAAAGAKLVICARRLEPLKTLAAELANEFDTKTHYFQLDVRDKQAVKQALDSLPQEFSRIDCLINNAGLARGAVTYDKYPEEAFEEMVDTNIKGLLYVTHAVLPGMVARNSGYIVNLGSIAGREAYRLGSVYCGTKAFVKMFTEGLISDLVETKLRVTCIDPGRVETEFSLVRYSGDKQRADQVYKNSTPLKAEDIAELILFTITRPDHVNISNLLVMPTDQASVALDARNVKA